MKRKRRPYRTTIKIASTHRRWTRQGRELGNVSVLYFDLAESQFIVLYRDGGWDTLPGTCGIVETCTKEWLENFVRNQCTLGKESHWIRKAPSPEWRTIIEQIVAFKESDR